MQNFIKSYRLVKKIAISAHDSQYDKFGLITVLEPGGPYPGSRITFTCRAVHLATLGKMYGKFVWRDGLYILQEICKNVFYFKMRNFLVHVTALNNVPKKNNEGGVLYGNSSDTRRVTLHYLGAWVCVMIWGIFVSYL